MLTVEEAREALTQAEIRATREALVAADGHVANAAAALGISRQTLWRRMKQYGLERRVQITERA